MRRMLKRSAVPGLALALSGCLELPTIPGGACGNYIIDEGEDCDGALPRDRSFPEGTPPEKRATCGEVGSARACRLDCSGNLDCPSTYHCGADGICRQPSGEFGTFAVIPASPAHVAMGDFDGDGRDDLLTLDGDTGDLRVHFFERDGVLSHTFGMPSDGAVPAIGRLATTGTDLTPHDDFTLTVQTGLGVMQGQADRSFMPTVFPAVSEEVERAYLVTLQAMPVDDFGVTRWSDDVLIFLPAGATGWMAFSPQGGGTKRFNLPTLPDSGDTWIPRLPKGDFDANPTSSPCEELVLVTQSSAVAQVITPCRRQGADLVWNDQSGTPYPPVRLSDPSVKMTAALAAHVNQVSPAHAITGRDGHLDLVLGDDQGKVWVAYGRGDGTFGSAPGMPSGDDRAAPAPWMASMPLAIADLDRDGAPDLVLRSGVHLSRTGELPTSTADYALTVGPPGTSPTDALEEALVVDFNGDGLLDVIAVTRDTTGVVLYTNTGKGVFNTDVAATERPASHLEIGDFDGDLQQDIIFRESSDGEPDGLFIMYGRAGEPPLAPALLGSLPHVAQIVAGVDLMHRRYQNAFSDMVVLTEEGGNHKAASIFEGRPDRLLQSPFSFRLAGEAISETLGPSAVAIGRFQTPDALGVAAVVLTEGGCGAEVEPRLWWLDAAAGAVLSQAGEPVKLCERSATLAWETAALATADVRGTGRDDLVMLVRNAGQGKGAALFVSDGTSSPPALGEAIPLPAEFSDPRLAGGPPQIRKAPPICVADIDGDRALDVIALADDGAGGGEVAILWGKKGASPPFSADRIDRVQTAGGGALVGVTAFTCTDADGDGASDLVIATRDQLFLVDGSHGQGVKATELEDPETNIPLRGGISVASGDMDGDGISDLSVSGASGVATYLGRPVIR